MAPSAAVKYPSIRIASNPPRSSSKMEGTSNHDSPTNHHGDPLNPSHDGFTAPRHPNRWQRWSGFLSRHRHVVIVFWLAIVWPFGIYCKPRFLEATDSSFAPLPGSPSYEADAIYNDAYTPSGAAPVVVLLQQEGNFEESAIDGASSLYNSTLNFVTEYERYLNDLTLTKEVEILSYYKWEEEGVPTLAAFSFTADGGRSQILRIRYELISGDKEMRNDFLTAVVAFGDAHAPPFHSVSYTGEGLFQIDMLKGAEENMKTMDRIALPLAFLILALTLKGNVPLLLVPLLMIGTVVLTWSIIMYPLAKFNVLQVSQFTPSVMMSLTLALGVDYSLFLLSRAQEELKRSDDVVAVALEHSGHSILASGSTILVCFLGLAMLPSKMLVSIGVGAGVAVLSCLIVNLTLVPAILHTRFGSLLLRFQWNMVWERINCKDAINSVDINRVEDADSMELDALSNPLIPRDYEPDATESPDIVHYSTNDPISAVEGNSMWFSLGKLLVRFPRNIYILIAVLCFIIPVAHFAPKLKTSISYEYMLPHDSPALETYHNLGRSFGKGAMSPYKLIIDGTKADKHVNTPRAFEVMQTVLTDLTNENLVSPLTSCSGIYALDGYHIPFVLYALARECGVSCIEKHLRSIAFMDHEMTTPDQKTSFVNVILTVDPTSINGTDWLVATRQLIQSHELHGYEVVLQAGVAAGYDTVQAIYTKFPIMILVTTVTVLILMGIFFKSIVAPIRSVISISLTVLFVFGLAVLVYQYGILNWTGIRAVSSYSLTDTGHGEMSYLSPVMAFSIIVGLGLDYDVFLITRVLEYREQAFTDKSSIVLGLEGTGKIITAAGVIMAVAFGGLLNSASLGLCQFAFLLTTAVLLDTFVIRTLVVPILLGLSAMTDYSWWPRKLPSPTKDIVVDA